MTNYTKTTDFAAKDSLPSGDSGKIIRGSEFETEFDNIATAVNSKSDANNPTFTGTVTIDGLTVNGNTNLGNAGTDTVTVTANMLFGDGNKAVFGNDSDLEIYHNPLTLGTIVNHTATSGVLTLNSDGSGVNIYSNDATALMAQFVAGGASKLFFNASQKLSTTNTGIDVNGSITSDGIDTGIYAVETGVVKITNAGNPRVELLHPTNSTDTYLESTSAGSIELRADVNNEGTGTYILGEIDGNTTFKSYNGGDFALYEDTGATEKLRWDASAERLGIGNSSPTTALDVTGTVTADNLTSQAGANATDILTLSGSAAGRTLTVQSYDTTLGGAGFDINASASAGEITLQTNTKDRLRVEATGDISFYEDTGTTAKFFWDASAESLGIGTTSPSVPLEVEGSVKFGSAATGVSFAIQSTDEYQINGIDIDGNGFNSLHFRADGTDGLFIEKDTNNVGIGTSLPGSALEVVGRIATSGGSADIQSNLFGAGDGSETNPSIRNIGDSDTGFWFPAANTIGFSTGGSEAMRINSSGSVGIGTGAPAKELHISSSSPDIRLEDSDGTNQYAEITESGGSLFIGSRNNASNGALIFRGLGGGSADEHMRIDSSGNVGIGTTSPAAPLAVQAGSAGTTVASFKNSGFFGLTITPQVGGSGAVTDIRLGAGESLSFSPSNTEAMRINSSGTVKVSGTNNVPLELQNSATSGNCRISLQTADYGVVSIGQQATGTVTVYDNVTAETTFSVGPNKVLTATGGLAGIQLGGATVSNQLDDYEEGTWTPVVSGANGLTIGASPVYSATYTKIGRLVYFTAILDFNSTDTVDAGDRVLISSLPFTVNSAIETITGVGTAVVYNSYGSNLLAQGTVGLDGSTFLSVVITNVSGSLTHASKTRISGTYIANA